MSVQVQPARFLAGSWRRRRRVRATAIPILLLLRQEDEQYKLIRACTLVQSMQRSRRCVWMPQRLEPAAALGAPASPGARCLASSLVAGICAGGLPRKGPEPVACASPLAPATRGRPHLDLGREAPRRGHAATAGPHLRRRSACRGAVAWHPPPRQEGRGERERGRGGQDGGERQARESRVRGLF